MYSGGGRGRQSPKRVCVCRRATADEKRQASTRVSTRQARVPGTSARATVVADIIETMNWNDAAEDLLNQVLAQTPRPVRDATETQLRETAEALAEEDGKNRVGVETVIVAWVRNTPATLRPDLPRQMEKFGLDPDEYRRLLD